MQTEAEVTKECVEHLHRLGWRPKRNHVGTFYTRAGTPVHIGDTGEPDWLFLKPNDVIFLELKRPGEKPKPIQNEFIAKLRHFGYKAGWCDSLDRLKELLNGWGFPAK